LKTKSHPSTTCAGLFVGEEVGRQFVPYTRSKDKLGRNNIPAKIKIKNRQASAPSNNGVDGNSEAIEGTLRQAQGHFRESENEQQIIAVLKRPFLCGEDT